MESNQFFCFLCESFPSKSQEDLQLHFIEAHSNFFLPKFEPIQTELELDDNNAIDDHLISGFGQDFDIKSDIALR
jgi:hypothetical protein